MKNTSKILALALVAVMLLTSLMVIPASAAEETKTYVFESKDLGANAAGTWTDGQEVAAGTENFFTLIMSSKSKVDSSSKEWKEADYPGNAYSSSLRLNFGAKSTTTTNLVKFTTQGPATLKVWWVSNGDGRANEIWNAEGSTVATIDGVTKNSLAFSTVTLSSAGTYYFATPSGGSNYIFKMEISVQVETCDHTGGTATCKDLAVCDLCGKPYGELSTEHKYDNGSCTVCGEADPDACQHTNKTPADCTLPETCADCGETFGDALGHTPVDDAAVAPTCTEKGLKAGSHCSRCGETIVKQEEVDALGHTLTFVQTHPAGELKGKTTASCSVCDFTYESAEVGIMGKGTYVLDAADLAGIAQNSLFDGEVKVVNGIFACHLSAKYYTETYDSVAKKKEWADGYASSHRMNFGGKSELLDNGEDEEAVKNGGLKNFIQITTVGDEVTVTIHWICGGNGRQVALYKPDGTIGDVSTGTTLKNEPYVSVLKVPAGTWLIGTDCTNAEGGGGNYFCNIEVDVHEHEWHDATCETPKYCDCGAEEGDTLPHTWVDATCTAPKTCSECGETEGEALPHTWVDANCTTAKTCSECHETEGEALEHTWIDATCETPKTCSVCGETEDEALGHDMVTDAAVAPTCTETGLTEGAHCSRCDKATTAQETVEALGHDYAHGVCTRCAEVDPEYTIWNKIMDMIMAFIQKVLGFFKKA